MHCLFLLDDTDRPHPYQLESCTSTTTASIMQLDEKGFALYRISRLTSNKRKKFVLQKYTSHCRAKFIGVRNSRACNSKSGYIISNLVRLPDLNVLLSLHENCMRERIKVTIRVR